MRSHRASIRAQIRLRRRLAATACALVVGGVAAAAGTLLASPAEVPLLALAPDAEPGPQAVEAASAPAAVADPIPETLDLGPAAVAAEAVPSDLRWYNGRPIRPARTLRMLVTAYSPDERSCGRHADGITASGYSVWTNGMKMVAADTTLLPFGSLVSVPGYDGDAPVPVLDRGGAIKGHRLDVLFPTHESALRWGSRWLEVTVWDYADGKGRQFRTAHRR